MELRSFKFEKIFIFFCFLLYPVYTLPWIIKYMLKNEKLGYIMFSLFMGFLAYLFIPYNTMDITRHYESFKIISELSFYEIGNHGSPLSYITYVYMWILNQLHLPKEFLPFSFVFFSYYLLLLVIMDISNNYKKSLTLKKWLPRKRHHYLFLFIFLNNFRFFYTASGLRNTFAISLFIYSVYRIYTQEKKIFPSFLIIFSIFIHISILPIALILIIVNFLKKKNISKLFFITGAIIIFLGLSVIIFYALIDLFEPFLKANGLYFRAYMDRDGAWGGGFFKERNIKTIIYEKYIKPFPYYLSLIYLIVVKNSKEQKYLKLLYVISFFISLISISMAMFDRYIYMFSYIFMIFLMFEYKEKYITSFKKLFISLYIVALLMIDVFAIYKYRDIYIRSWGDTFYTPMIFKILDSVEPHQYIERNGR